MNSWENDTRTFFFFWFQWENSSLHFQALLQRKLFSSLCLILIVVTEPARVLFCFMILFIKVLPALCWLCVHQIVRNIIFVMFILYFFFRILHHYALPFRDFHKTETLQLHLQLFDIPNICFVVAVNLKFSVKLCFVIIVVLSSREDINAILLPLCVFLLRRKLWFINAILSPPPAMPTKHLTLLPLPPHRSAMYSLRRQQLSAGSAAFTYTGTLLNLWCGDFCCNIIDWFVMPITKQYKRIQIKHKSEHFRLTIYRDNQTIW